jgi:hypothetical protein
VVWLLVFDFRVDRFNREMKDFAQVAAKAEPGADVQTFAPNRAGWSDVFGYRAMATAPAWFVAEYGGIIQDDYASRFNLPVQRKKVSFPSRYRYIFSIADVAEIKKAFPDAALRARSGRWSLFERPLQTTGVFTIVRSGQGWGDLIIDDSVVQGPLSVAGVTYPRGLGTHADSWIQIRPPAGKTTLEGACGLDDSGRVAARIRCDVRQLDGAVLFSSDPMKKGDPPVPFSVKFPEHGDLILEIFGIGENKGTHGDWIDLT